jgi:hypothetical protein
MSELIPAFPKMHEHLAVIVRTGEEELWVMRFFSEKPIDEERVVTYLKKIHTDWNDEDDRVFLLPDDLPSNDLDQEPEVTREGAD